MKGERVGKKKGSLSSQTTDPTVEDESITEAELVLSSFGHVFQAHYQEACLSVWEADTGIPRYWF